MQNDDAYKIIDCSDWQTDSELIVNYPKSVRIHTNEIKLGDLHLVTALIINHKFQFKS